MSAWAILILMQSGALKERRIADIFKPLGTPAQSIYNISLLTLTITGVIFLFVAGFLTYTLVRFRHRENQDYQEPAQVYGSNQIEVAWTVIPILIVFVLVGVTARVIAEVQDAKPPAAAVKATIIGHQWWWEIRYPDLGIVTANELHVPVSASASDRPTFLQLESVDVIHSFWIPQLAGKTDVIPNQVNQMWIDPRQPGTYLGNCAEYCGTQHANMLLRVVAHPKGEFEQWVANQQKPAVNNPKLAAAKAAFESLSCVSCHVVRGTAAVGKFGPDLTHLMSRKTLGAGVLANNAGTLRGWIYDPQTVKPGCLMPSMKLSAQEVNLVATYLQALR